MSMENLAGILVPPVTPFHEDGSVDYPSFRRLLRALYAGGVRGVVVNGTTSESPTVRWDEVERLFAVTREESPAGALVIVGTGSNDTASTLEQTARAQVLGADAALVVSPYYNRPSQAGLLAHFTKVNEMGLPIICYNIPYRTGVALEPATLRAVMDLPNIIGIKESTGGLGNTIDMVGWCKKAILCGEDLLVFSSMCLGGAGGILAAAHLRTADFVAMYQHCARGEFVAGRELFLRLTPLIKLLFEESNPGPLKWALWRLGVIASPVLRLPMTGISSSLQKRLDTALGL